MKWGLVMSCEDHGSADDFSELAVIDDTRRFRPVATFRQRRWLVFALAPLLSVLFWLATWELTPSWDIAFSPDGKYLAASSVRRGRGAARIWDVHQRRLAWSIDSDSELYRLAFSPDGKTLAAGRADGSIACWDVATHAERIQVASSNAGIFGLGYSDDGKKLVSVAGDGEVKTWDVADGELKEAVTIKAPQFAWGAPAISHDARRAAVSFAGSRKDGVQLYDLASGQPLVEKFVPHVMRAAVFSRDGQLLALVGQSKLRIWSVESKQFVGTFGAPNSTIFAVDFSPNGKAVVTAGQDGLALWDLASGQRLWLARVPSENNHFFAVAFSPDGQSLVAGAAIDEGLLWRQMTSHARVYDAATGQELAVLEPNRPYWAIFAGWIAAFSIWAIAWIRRGLVAPSIRRAFADALLIGGIIVAALVIRLATTGASGDQARLPAATGLGALTGLFGLVVVWAVLARSRWQRRAPGLVAGWAAIWAILIAICNARDFGQEAIWQVTIGASAMLAILLLLLQIVQSRGFRLSLDGDDYSPTIGESPEKRQFRLRDIMAWTLAAALLFGVARFFVPVAQPTVIIGFVITIGAGLGLACAAGAWAVLGRSPLVIRLFALALVPLVSGSMAELFRNFVATHPWLWYVAFDISASLFVAGTLAIFSCHGVRLDRIGSHAAI